ncbi:glycosyl transferase family 1 [Sporanaerobium hydrogeniformans]|uniref:Glycosyl transferase family 1 n=1 Tax=Sporanaerobium hydrogeniformans TaxID=3072179 RepID=A0AC61DF87_9FIRM|nr:glycosyltransferase family 4 protein [Sporanaerobium hydrogeniformans]PHV71351.1 glycosyl transferase family 1 [Sporanaerobium hydrogeniformans]
MIQVVHVAAHLGGGIGRILSSVAICSKENKQVRHTILTLEETQISQFQDLCREHDIQVIGQANCNVEELIEEADIVQVDWWHHPLTSEFMSKYLEKIKCRLVIWSHISGCNYPYISPQLVKVADQFLFSTPFSYENSGWSREQREEIKTISDVIISSGVDFKGAVVKKEHNTFNVGYIGFLSYNKIHPEFVKFCEAAAHIPNINFEIIGDMSYGGQLQVDVNNSSLIKDRVVFEGYVLNVEEKLRELDVFGYPLNPEHYGTAENALLEAMAAGVVPVVLNQCIEKYTVQHMKTGLIVNNIKEYGEAIHWLSKYPEERIRLGNNASAFIIREYSVQKTVERLNAHYIKLMQKHKTFHDIRGVVGTTPYEWFKSGYSGDDERITGNAFAETKGSVKHYVKYFPQDKKLREVVEKNESRIKTIL